MYIRGCAQKEIDIYANELIVAKPDKIIELQNKIKARQLAMNWIVETIKAGEDAVGTLRGNEE